MSPKPAPVPPRFTRPKPVVRFPDVGVRKLREARGLPQVRALVQLTAQQSKDKGSK